MRLGAMVTLWDRSPIALPELGFLELLVLPQDDMAEVKGFCDGFDGELIVHAPEELPDGRPLDLASPDKGWREASVRRVREVTKAAEGTARPVVIHPGGVTEAPVQEAGPLLGALRSSLEDLPDYTWLENMPLHHHHRGRRLHREHRRTHDRIGKNRGSFHIGNRGLQNGNLFHSLRRRHKHGRRSRLRHHHRWRFWQCRRKLRCRGRTDRLHQQPGTSEESQ